VGAGDGGHAAAGGFGRGGRRAARNRLRAILAGGAIGDGAQDRATTVYDAELQEALVDDFLAERYGWTCQQIDDAPHQRKINMMTVAKIRHEVETEQTRRAGSGGGVGAA
jgi:hypothetical protein